MSLTAPQPQCTELWLLLFTYWILHPVCMLQTFKKQQVSASKDWQAREREGNLSWSYSNLLSLIWKVRCSPSPRLSHLCALLCWVKLPDSPGKDVPSTAKPAQGGLFQKDIGFFLRRTLLPACPALVCQLSRKHHGLFHWPCHWNRLISLELSANNACLELLRSQTRAEASLSGFCTSCGECCPLLHILQWV